LRKAKSELCIVINAVTGRRRAIGSAACAALNCEADEITIKKGRANLPDLFIYFNVF